MAPAKLADCPLWVKSRANDVRFTPMADVRALKYDVRYAARHSQVDHPRYVSDDLSVAASNIAVVLQNVRGENAVSLGISFGFGLVRLVEF